MARGAGNSKVTPDDKLAEERATLFQLTLPELAALDLAIFGTSILLAAVIAMLWIWLQDLQQARSWLVEQSSQLLLKTIDFEREIGFGGFIHNFKNAVLRPDELFYISAASSNLANALLMLDELDQQILIAGAPIDLYPIRKTLEQYSQSIQTLIDQPRQTALSDRTGCPAPCE